MAEQPHHYEHPEPILQFFEYTHLKPEMQNISKLFHDMAHHIVGVTPRSAERTAGLRKLLESKDCIVRAHVFEI